MDDIGLTIFEPGKGFYYFANCSLKKLSGSPPAIVDVLIEAEEGRIIKGDDGEIRTETPKWEGPLPSPRIRRPTIDE